MPAKFLFFLFLAVASYGQQLPLIPQPAQLTRLNENFTLTAKTVIESPQCFEADFLHEAILSQTGLSLKIVEKATTNAIRLQLQTGELSDSGKESYQLTTQKNEVKITAKTSQGIFYGVQTLLQAIPIQKSSLITIPGMSIADTPKYQWRGMHLDTARHFFSVEFVKKYIDYIAMYKMNTFHWHLTDDQGWRIEIEKYPKLTQIGGWRSGSMVGHFRDQKFDTIRYGGFYTQDEIRDVIDYAKKRHITIIPEIEMPGHVRAALAAYPELSCTGGPFETAKEWGILEDVLCPKESTFTFMEDVLTEVMALFPAEYIHIGGDECPKIRWKQCQHCQSLIKEKGLKDEQGLQSYFIRRIEAFVNSKGRKVIGWDEILDGGLAPNAAVMSWHGTKPAIAAAKQCHYAVMSPGSHCYFDAYQGDPKFEPVTIGGYLPVEKVYAFQPTSKTLTDEESKYILGGQANLWTEYIATPEQVEYMVMPRMAALAEVLWGTSDPEKYPEFRQRLIEHFKVYEAKGINYAKNIFEPKVEIAPLASRDGISVNLESVSGNGIYYTLDGSAPNLKSNAYQTPTAIDKPAVVTASYFENGKQLGNPVSYDFHISKTTGKTVTLENQPSESYNGGGTFTLVNGLYGDPKRYGQDWLGFNGTDLSATIDFEKTEDISTVSLNFIENQSSWIHFPQSVEIRDDQNRLVTTIKAEEIKRQNGRVSTIFPKVQTSKLKVLARNAGIIPAGKPGAGSKAFLFVDEISAE
jgi:hexosaminidase